MNDEQALLRSILEAPDDDAPRLVYADWLEEHGQPERAEFIRVQIEKVACSNPSHLHHGDASYRARLTSRSNLLWKQHRSTWLPWGRKELLSYPSRGFVTRVACQTGWFLEHAAQLFSREPVMEVRLSDRRPGFRHARYRWHLTGRPDEVSFSASNLPRLIGSLLSGTFGDRNEYSTEQLAFLDLSEACVTLGRDLAGLRFLAKS